MNTEQRVGPGERKLAKQLYFSHNARRGISLVDRVPWSALTPRARSTYLRIAAKALDAAELLKVEQR